jgi:hypothetical protein
MNTHQHDTPQTPPQQHRATWPALREAEREGKDALEAFLRADIRERLFRAEQEWQDYSLFAPGKQPTREKPMDPALLSKSYTAVVSPEGKVYTIDVRQDGVKRFLNCPAQHWLDGANDAARRVGSMERVEGKHVFIERFLNRAIFMGLREWKWFPALDGMAEGFYSVPTRAAGGIR